MSRFYEIPDYPEKASGPSILTRLLDGLGFRFYWSTEGLRDEDYSYRPSHDSRSIDEIVRHIWGLVNWVCISIVDVNFEKPTKIEFVRNSILDMLSNLRDTILSLSDGDLEKIQIEHRSRARPFWHLINGPISDALTHVGQINSFRRLSGNPSSKVSVFLGLPPNA